MKMAVLWGIFVSAPKHNSDTHFGDFGLRSENGGSFGVVWEVDVGRFGCSKWGSSSRHSYLAPPPVGVGPHTTSPYGGRPPKGSILSRTSFRHPPLDSPVLEALDSKDLIPSEVDDFYFTYWSFLLILSDLFHSGVRTSIAGRALKPLSSLETVLEPLYLITLT